MKKLILLFFVFFGVLFADFIREDTNGTVYDTATKNQWQDFNLSSTVNWVDANVYCEDLNLSGHTDWHLPNINQLFLLVDITEQSPAIDDVFSNKNSTKYWSSTTQMKESSKAYVVDFSDGKIFFEEKDTNTYDVRCVRDW